MITRGQSLPPLARRLSDDAFRACRWILVLAVALGVIGTAVWIAAAEGVFASTGEVLGWPLVAIGERGPANIFGWEAAVGEEPRGWISIGRRPVGFFAFGFQPTGVIAIGQFPAGVLAIGWVAVGVLPIGLTALGLASLGLASGGWLSFGVACAGRYAYGSPLGSVSLGASCRRGVRHPGFARLESKPHQILGFSITYCFYRNILSKKSPKASISVEKSKLHQIFYAQNGT